jgi:hypothetical protein
MHIEALSMQTNRSLFLSLCFVIATKKRNKLQLSRFISRSTRRNINQHLAARQNERKMEKKEEDKETSSPVVFSSEILLSFAVDRLKEQNKLLSSCIRYYISIITVDHFPTQQESEMLVILTYSSLRLDLIGDTKSQKSSFPLFFFFFFFS